MKHEKARIDVYRFSVVAVCTCGWARERPRTYGAYQFVEEALSFHCETYNKYVLNDGPSDDERHKGYKNTQLKFKTVTTGNMQHGVQQHKCVDK